MQLILNTRGTYLRKRGELFVVIIEKIQREFSARKVHSILITTSVLITTDAIQLAHEYNIDIVFLNKYGEPFSRVWHVKFGSTNLIRRRQLEYSGNKKGLELAKKWIDEKVENQIKLLEKLKKTREPKKEQIEESISKLQRGRKKLALISGDNLDEVREQIFSVEAHAGKIYWDTISLIIPANYRFYGRSRNPALDEFNALLNYGYGILYSRMERACILAGLDPYIGFLHTDNYGKTSFVFDLIEIFRIHIDQIVIKLFSKRMVKKEMFRKIQNGVLLDKLGKEMIISKFNEVMAEKIRYNNRNIKKEGMMETECHRIANNFIGKEQYVSVVDL
jgi:CRISPR-associated protein Cas1